MYKETIGQDFPQDPDVQLMEAVKAVFRSWDNPRANVYRRMNDIPGDWGTAVNIQTMVFGNMGNTSGTGVAFTRNPATGAKGIYGEYLIDARGGRRTDTAAYQQAGRRYAGLLQRIYQPGP